MASIDDITAALQTAIDEINDAVSAANTAGSNTEDLQNSLSAQGIQDKVAALNGVKATIDKLVAHLSSGIDIANDAITEAKAVADST